MKTVFSVILCLALLTFCIFSFLDFIRTFVKRFKDKRDKVKKTVSDIGGDKK